MCGEAVGGVGVLGGGAASGRPRGDRPRTGRKAETEKRVGGTGGRDSSVEWAGQERHPLVERQRAIEVADGTRSWSSPPCRAPLRQMYLSLSRHIQRKGEGEREGEGSGRAGAREGGRQAGTHTHAHTRREREITTLHTLPL